MSHSRTGQGLAQPRKRVWWEEADVWGGVRAGLGETDHARAWPGHAKGLGLDGQGNMEPLNLYAKNTECIWDLGRQVCSVEWVMGGGGCRQDSAFWKQVDQEMPRKNRSESIVTGWLRSKTRSGILRSCRLRGGMDQRWALVWGFELLRGITIHQDKQ